MKRFLVCLLLYLSATNAFASRQYYWSYGGTQIASGGNTCEFLKVAAGKPLFYTCVAQMQPNVPLTNLEGTSGNGVFLFAHPQFGIENAAFFKMGPAPDKCEAPRYLGPDGSKPPGQQCTRAACVAGDTTGSFEEPIRYYVTSTNVTKQTFSSPGTSTICQDGCLAKPQVNSGNCPSRVHSGDISYQFCNQIYLDTANICQLNTDNTAPVQPGYDPGTVPPPDPPLCGTPGQIPCPPDLPDNICGLPGHPACPAPTCGVPGKPSCYPGGTCGAAGQPMCTGGDGSGAGGSTAGAGSTNGGGTTPQVPSGPSCGVEGKPACASDSACGGPGQPSCAIGTGAGSPGGSCGGVNQPACVIDGSGTPDGVGLRGDTSGLEAKHKQGADAIDALSTNSITDWFPSIPTAACVNPTIVGPGGRTYAFAICGYVDIISVVVSAVICMFALFGSVRNVQDALKA